MGLIPAGAYKNRAFRESMTDFSDTVPRSIRDVFMDPQTSGGLLISVHGGQCNQLLAALKKAGIGDAAKIGEISDHPEERIVVV
jgi:selenide,water dikinase